MYQTLHGGAYADEKKVARCAGARLADCLHTLECGGRTIEYALIGEESASPVVLFYPMGACRRMAALLRLQAHEAGARLICVNRPGMGGASPVAQDVRVATACSDVVACLDYLGVERTAVLFMCAGAPFAMAFCSLHPDRFSGKIAGCSAWVSPADCPGALLLYRLGVGMPSSVVSSVAGAIAWCLQSAPQGEMPLDPLSDVVGAWSDGGAAAGALGGALAEWDQQLSWSQQEAGGEGEDATVLLQEASSWGVHYSALPHPVALFHGDADATVPIACAEWLIEQLPSRSELFRVPGGSHEDVMLCVVPDALQLLLHGKPRRGRPRAAAPAAGGLGRG